MTWLVLVWTWGASRAAAAGPVIACYSGQPTSQQRAGHRTQRGALAGDMARLFGAERLQTQLLSVPRPQQRGQL